MKKKVLVLFLAIVMVFAMTACGTPAVTTETTAAAAATTAAETTSATTTAEVTTTAAPVVAALKLDKSWPKETVKIGVETYDVTDMQFLAMQAYYTYLAKSFNIEFVYSESLANAEDELKFIENCAAAGCKAIIGYYNVAEGQVTKLCSDKGMYYFGTAYAGYEKNQYSLGIYENNDSDYNAGFAMAKTLADQGCKKVVYVSGGEEMGVPFFIKRAEGFNAGIKAAQDAGNAIKLVKKVAGFPGTDAFTAAQTAVADMDFDGMACSFTAAVWFQPLATVGKLDKIKIATIGTVDDMYLDLAKGGVVSCVVYECEEVLFGSAIPLILNAVTGHEFRSAEGGAVSYSVPRWIVDNGTDFQAIYNVHKEGNYLVTAEDVANQLVEFNKDASLKTFSDFYNSLDLKTALAKIKK